MGAHAHKNAGRLGMTCPEVLLGSERASEQQVVVKYEALRGPTFVSLLLLVKPLLGRGAC